MLLQVLCLIPHATTSTFPTGDWKANLVLLIILKMLSL
nr:MAG TPA: hypothetical protein [Crassvirales sp.]